jgi:hypothetical protein
MAPEVGCDDSRRTTSAPQFKRGNLRIRLHRHSGAQQCSVSDELPVLSSPICDSRSYNISHSRVRILPPQPASLLCSAHTEICRKRPAMCRVSGTARRLQIPNMPHNGREQAYILRPNAEIFPFQGRRVAETGFDPHYVAGVPTPNDFRTTRRLLRAHRARVVA